MKRFYLVNTLPFINPNSIKFRFFLLFKGICQEVYSIKSLYYTSFFDDYYHQLNIIKIKNPLYMLKYIEKNKEYTISEKLHDYVKTDFLEYILTYYLFYHESIFDLLLDIKTKDFLYVDILDTDLGSSFDLKRGNNLYGIVLKKIRDKYKRYKRKEDFLDVEIELKPSLNKITLFGSRIKSFSLSYIRDIKKKLKKMRYI